MDKGPAYPRHRKYFVGILTIIMLVVLGNVTAAWLWLVMEGVWALYGWTTGHG